MVSGAFGCCTPLLSHAMGRLPEPLESLTCTTITPHQWVNQSFTLCRFTSGADSCFHTHTHSNAVLECCLGWWLGGELC
eukprot:3856279-Amphidinium_carterae.1